MEENLSICIGKIMLENRKATNSFTELYNITGKQSRILCYIFDESGKKEVIQKDIEDFFGIRGASVTSMLQTLEKKKLIARKPSKIDARRKVLKVTKKGEDIYFKIHEKISEMERITVEGIDPCDLEIFKKCLSKILNNLYNCKKHCSLKETEAYDNEEEFDD